MQREPGAVRVNVQLINAATDAHLWADIYDQKITDIFSVESEIAGKIAASLEAKLSGSEKRAIALQPTDSAAAHQLFLKGLFFWNKRTGNDLKSAGDYFQQAITADPAYAAAYAGLAQAKLLIPVFRRRRAGRLFSRGKDRGLARHRTRSGIGGRSRRAGPAVHLRLEVRRGRAGIPACDKVEPQLCNGAPLVRQHPAGVAGTV